MPLSLLRPEDSDCGAQGASREAGLELGARPGLAFGCQERDSTSGESTEVRRALHLESIDLPGMLGGPRDGRPLWTQAEDLLYGQNPAVLGLAVCSSGFLFQTRRTVCVAGGGVGLSLGFIVGLLIMSVPGSRVGEIG